jgi:DNA-directed RNA polymerase specialized sigma24 family protein
VDDDEQLLVSLYADLRRFAAVVGPTGVEPDDLVQEAVARALARGPLARLSNPGAYLRTTVVRLASNRRRSARRADRAVMRLRATTTGRSLDVYPSDLDDLDRLKPADRAVLYLSLVDQRPDADIADLLEIPAATVRKRRSRAVDRLRRALTTTEEDRA